MRSKPVQRRVVSLVLIVVMMLASNATWAWTSALGLEGGSARLEDPPLNPRIVFQQNFDNESSGQIPNGWTVLKASPTVGNFTVDNSTDYVVQGNNSAKFVDDSTVDSPIAYRNFTQQNGTIIVSFAVSLPNRAGNHTGLEVSVDDGGFNGANIIFGDGVVQYSDGSSGLVTLRSSYVANRWYRIKFVMNMRDNIYNIHVDEHLEVAGARFNGSCNQVHRIAITEFSPPNPPGSRLSIGYIDDIEARVGIIIPTDFPTIQQGIDAASPGDVVYVTRRIYFENITILPKQTGIWLIGENVSTTVIDGRFAKAIPGQISVMNCSNVTIYGFTIRLSAANGAQIYLKGSGNTVTNNIIDSGLGDGISISGSDNTVSNNVVNSTLQCGIRVFGSNSTITNNVVLSSLDTGIFLAGSNSNLTHNVIQSNQVGINLSAGDGNLVRNNTIEANGVGLQCGTDASHSLVCGNRFVGNDEQALDNGVSNKWDKGYPYSPENETGGGNYWSDLGNCTDVYSGPNQNERANCSWASPDGICDQPYHVSSNSTDHYPLFLVQSVTQNPRSEHINCTGEVFDRSVDYSMNVTVTATALKFVKIVNASLCVDYTNASGTVHANITMKVSGNNLTGIIPHQPYGTTVRYNVSVLAPKAARLNSTSYPIPFPCFVDDWTPPTITNVRWVPSGPDENQKIDVYATATEPADASQVDKVYVSYLVNFTWWTAEMTRIATANYTAVIPRQPGNATLNLNVTAVDRAGNWAPPKNNTQYVKRLAQLSVINDSSVIAYNPCSIDLGVMSGDQTYTSGFNVTNINGQGDDPLIWNITTVKGGAWLVSINPLGGNVSGGKSVRVTVTVDTHYCTDSGVYLGELSVNATGTVSQWSVIITFTVRNVIIDKSWASSEAPSRCNINTTQYFAFHAKWTNNCSDATGGSMKITGSPFVHVNGTGWALFNHSSTVPANMTFGVEGAKFGPITSFAQTASNRTTIWDCVKIVLTTVNDYMDVGSSADVSWNGSYYEVDKTPFDGEVVFNDSLTRDHVDEAWIGTSFIIDYTYPDLTAFDSNSVYCIWDEIKIIGGGVSRSQTSVGQIESVWFIGVYERDNKLFKGMNGTLFVNNSPCDWSSDVEVWRMNCTLTTQGTEAFQVSGVVDNVHNLTRIKDGVGPLSITWGEPAPRPWWEAWWPTSGNVTVEDQPVQRRNADVYTSWAVVIVVIVGTGWVLTLLILMSSGKKSKSKNGHEKAVPPKHSINTPSSKR